MKNLWIFIALCVVTLSGSFYLMRPHAAKVADLEPIPVEEEGIVEAPPAPPSRNYVPPVTAAVAPRPQNVRPTDPPGTVNPEFLEFSTDISRKRIEILHEKNPETKAAMVSSLKQELLNASAESDGPELKSFAANALAEIIRQFPASAMGNGTENYRYSEQSAGAQTARPYDDGAEFDEP